jgi:lysophospholipase L1-like esterase
MRLGIFLLVIFSFISCKTHSQDLANKNFNALNKYSNVNFFGIVDSSLATKYPFIHFERDHYQFYTYDSPNFEKLFYDIQQMVKYRDRKLNFYHIGGSHLQADIYSNYMREKLQSYWGNELIGERGFIFPFNLAGTNNPGSYHFESPNRWHGYRSVVQRGDSLAYGLMGMAISCGDTSISMSFEYRKTTSKPPIDHVRIYHNKGTLPYAIQYDTTKVKVLRQTTNEALGFTETYFENEVQSFQMKFTRLADSLLTDSLPTKSLFIYGFHLMNKRPGISYTTIGVNGAGLYTYLDNVNYEEQLTEYPPDFMAFSVGTNDANTTYEGFSPQKFKRNLESMMQKALRANPNCAILLTVPNDAYYKKKYLNKNVAREREMIIELAKQYKLPVWDFYGIMGELGSSKKWQLSGLMRPDLVHFTPAGYKLKGEMFFESFLKWLEQMELRRESSLIRHN